MTVKTPVIPSARLIEVFSAIQGEGHNVGTRQIFIRFALCDLRCHFCDSAHTWHVPKTCRIEQTPGLRDFEIYSNPVPLPILLESIKQQNLPGLHDSISITGGEPLLHAAFLVEFLPQLCSVTGLPVYLESGGHRPEELAMILPNLNSVGMDFKLPSVSGESRWQEHTKFLQLCNDSQIEVFVKIIVSNNTDLADLKRSSEIVAAINPSIKVFLQPVTPLKVTENPTAEITQETIIAPSPEQVLSWQALMKQNLKDVRVIPQTHKMLNQL
jgi:7-carboxy-7-deazaguanine synthase